MTTMRYLLLIVVVSLPLRPAVAGCPQGGSSGNPSGMLAELLDDAPAAVRMAAAAERVSVEALRARLLRAEQGIEAQARAVAEAQGLDVRSAERYVSGRVAAFRAAELRRLLKASPALEAHLKPRARTMSVGTPACAHGARKDLDWARITALLTAFGLVVGYGATRVRRRAKA